MGRAQETDESLGSDWPGIQRSPRIRPIPATEIGSHVVLDPAELQEFGSAGTVITDDNQLLANRREFIGRLGVRDPGQSLALIRAIAASAN